MYKPLFASRVTGRAAVAVSVVRVVVGAFFILVSIPKFPFSGAIHDYEVSEFIRFGFPPNETIVILVGIAEFVAGVMLVLGIGTRVAATGLAIIMIGAISTAGVRVGGWFHLGVAPTMLAVMLVLLYLGSGAAALDRKLA